MNIKVVVTVNKNDVWFCRICIASIRYYYPDVEILILKDELKGPFSTHDLETYWNVKRADYPPNKFGWGSAKMFLLKDPAVKDQLFLLLDSDIVFIGSLLEKLQPMTEKYDFIVSPEYADDPYTDYAAKTYFDVKKAETEHQEYKYPGYFFNTGQMLVRAGKLSKEDMELFMDFDNYPYWTRLKDFPLVDQSMLNFLFPILASQKKITVGTEYAYMLWSQNPVYRDKISVDDIKDGKKYPMLIHWAGAKRVSYINAMSNNNILRFFEEYYYSKIPGGKAKQLVKQVDAFFTYYIRGAWYGMKRAVWKMMKRS